ncbi:MAG: endonuclease III [Candidatus Zixiibacteriota bacterium]
MPRESRDNKIKRAKTCIKLLRKHYPGASTSLKYKSVHQLMVATILSAQCTDERVNMVTPTLFEKYPDVRAFADADLEVLAQDIFTTGFYNQKAKSIINSAKALIERHNGEIPRKLDDLVKLPGVGRKTASVILGNAYGIAEGIVVDTHVMRISRLLGFTKHEDAVKVENDLMDIIERREWIDFSHMLILHGRAICVARRPDCPRCFLNKLCPSARL